MIIGKDLFNLFWLKHNKIKTYTTELSYVYWSEKILKEKYSKAIRIGLYDKNKYKKKYFKIKDHIYNLRGPGVLTPGLSQIFFMMDFVNFYQKKFK
jgi:hypothetical protein